MLDFWRVKHRKFKWDDLYNMQALINMIAENEDDPLFYTLEWLHYELSQPDVNPTENCFVATIYGGRIVGYSRLVAGDDPTYKTVVAGTHPNMHNVGIGRALITVNDFNLMAILPDEQPLTIARTSQINHEPSVKILTYARYEQVGTSDNDTLLWEKQVR